MSQITIIPIDRVVVLNGSVASEVDMTSVDPTIHAIQFDTESLEGTVEYKGVTPHVEVIESIEPWEFLITEAEEIIICKQNPKTFYSTVPPVGRKIVVTEKGWPQPSDSTEKPPTDQPCLNTSLYWDGSAEYVWSVFPIDLSLPDAQNYVANVIRERTYSLLQPSDWMVVRQSETGGDIPEDWGTWREAVREESKVKRRLTSEKGDLVSLSDYCNSMEFHSWPISPSA
jgi:hypothetical protein